MNRRRVAGSATISAEGQGPPLFDAGVRRVVA